MNKDQSNKTELQAAVACTDRLDIRNRPVGSSTMTAEYYADGSCRLTTQEVQRDGLHKTVKLLPATLLGRRVAIALRDEARSARCECDHQA